MSRSYKKPWVKDTPSKGMKRLYSKMIRKHYNQEVRHFFIGNKDDIVFVHRNWIVNKWNYCDWKYYIDRPEYRRK